MEQAEASELSAPRQEQTKEKIGKGRGWSGTSLKENSAKFLGRNRLHGIGYSGKVEETDRGQ